MQKHLQCQYKPKNTKSLYSHADFLQPVVSKEEVPPEQQQWIPLVDQEDPEPPHIKEEQEEPWTNQEGEQLQPLEESDIKFTLTPFTVKSEEDEEKPHSSQLHQSQNEENRADGGKPEPARNSGPDGYLQPGPEHKTEDSSETDDSEDDWMETREPESAKRPISMTGRHWLMPLSLSVLSVDSVDPNPQLPADGAFHMNQAGRSRSATIVTAYLMKRHQLGFIEAYHRLKSVKQDVHLEKWGLDAEEKESPLTEVIKRTESGSRLSSATGKTTAGSGAARWPAKCSAATGADGASGSSSRLSTLPRPRPPCSGGGRQPSSV
ncbi:unnamed protein product [Pleuronectes platessa]|uniref:Uncharacterized protein n=1 Tax=Pleuronectes platessa TaxID=8262 RepID=A0A9N7YBM2_PLEPL|nr:unnamed protein product [Pleuronectes platessa]